MKRKALLIGNTNGLPGVQIDMQTAEKFLFSDNGGAWINSEIDVLRNPRRAELLAHVAQVRQSSPDYVFLLFSGHGGLERRTTMLQLNREGETIEEDELFKIAPRQISIFDCCRLLVSEIAFEAFAAHRVRKMAEDSVAREHFDARIMQAIPQQIRLYASSMGQASSDTGQGAIYLQNLLRAARSFSGNETFKTAEQAHGEATRATIIATHGDQKPDAYLPKCLTSQQLILSARL